MAEPSTDPAAPAPRRRDAASTAERLLDAARRRFALEGYAAASTREIAGDAGVNVALISRYFGSKQGLFEACLRPAVEALRASADTLSSPEGVVRVLLAELASGGDGAGSGAMLLLRSAGDEALDALRLDVLRELSEQLATLVPASLPQEERLLRAQLTLSVGLGIAVMRTSIGLAPLRDASAEALAGPIRELTQALLAAPQAAEDWSQQALT